MLRKVVCGHRLPTTDLLGYIIIFESLRAELYRRASTLLDFLPNRHAVLGMDERHVIDDKHVELLDASQVFYHCLWGLCL